MEAEKFNNNNFKKLYLSYFCFDYITNISSMKASDPNFSPQTLLLRAWNSARVSSNCLQQILQTVNRVVSLSHQDRVATVQALLCSAQMNAKHSCSYQECQTKLIEDDLPSTIHYRVSSDFGSCKKYVEKRGTPLKRSKKIPIDLKKHPFYDIQKRKKFLPLCKKNSILLKTPTEKYIEKLRKEKKEAGVPKTSQIKQKINYLGLRKYSKKSILPPIKNNICIDIYTKSNLTTAKSSRINERKCQIFPKVQTERSVQKQYDHFAKQIQYLRRDCQVSIKKKLLL